MNDELRMTLEKAGVDYFLNSMPAFGRAWVAQSP